MKVLIEVPEYTARKLARLNELNELIGNLQQERDGIYEDLSYVAASLLIAGVQEVPTPKVGDRVECLSADNYMSPGWNLSGLRLGMNGTLVEIGDDGGKTIYRVEWDGATDWWHLLEHIKKI